MTAFDILKEVLILLGVVIFPVACAMSMLEYESLRVQKLGAVLLVAWLSPLGAVLSAWCLGIGVTPATFAPMVVFQLAIGSIAPVFWLSAELLLGLRFVGASRRYAALVKIVIVLIAITVGTACTHFGVVMLQSVR